ncbi:TraB/GumN family protein [Pedobacter gandavensis]|uniref:TraB/GumN family protein n=1 Tax=Pedobacter gandavensis TaxID=2679963 RepID=UPI0029314C78|nr:TraB/GumN family protein [Pedobacter gandavensis]
MNTSYKLLILFTFLFKSIMVSAQIPDETVSETLLWSVSGNGLKKTSYLFGTNHLYGGSFLDSIAPVLEAFNKSNVLLVERQMDSSYSINNSKNETPTDGYVPYSALFPKEMFTQVDKYLASIGVDSLGSLDNVKFPAWKLYFTIQMDYFSKKFKITPKNESSMDFHMQNLASNNGKKIVGLDNFSKRKPAPSSKLFGNPKEIAQGIISMINYIQKGVPSVHISLPAEELDKINDYRDLNIQYHFNEVTPGKNIPFVQELLIKRNTSWLAVLPSILVEQSCFVAVGLKHLMYKEGLISQLKAKGYDVKPVVIKYKSNL